MFCNVEKDAVITAKDVETDLRSADRVPEGRAGRADRASAPTRYRSAELREWDAMVQKIKYPKHEVSVALVGKYAGLKECYKSLAESLVHGGSTMKRG